MITDETGKTNQLLELLRPGMTVYLPGSSGEPTAALQALAQAPDCCNGVHFITSFVPGINTFDLATLGDDARFTAFFMHPSLRTAAAQERVRCLEMSYSEIATYLSRNPVDLAIVQVAADGALDRLNLGPAVEFTPIVLQHARTKVALQNQQTPWLPGSYEFPAEEIDLVIQTNTPLPIYADPVINHAYARMGEQVASLVPNGACLQTGLGQAPAAALNALSQHRGLNLHSGVFSDSLLRLIDVGAMQADSGIMTGVAVGSSGFYQRLPDYPGIRYAAVSETHSTEKLADKNKLFTINSAIEVDLQGNLNAEFLRGRRISGRGGLPDFTAAGHRSPKGASIIVLPATDAKGLKSRIVPQLESSATVSGEWIDCVITEFGCADLRGRSKTERATALRAIAAPQLRDSLEDGPD